MRIFLATILAISSVSAFSHPGSAEMHWHLFEHVLLALVIGVPAAYGLARLVMRRGKVD